MARDSRTAVKVQGRNPAASANSAEDIARVAYQLFERRGGIHGHDLEDWLEAERIVRVRSRTR